MMKSNDKHPAAGRIKPADSPIRNYDAARESLRTLHSAVIQLRTHPHAAVQWFTQTLDLERLVETAYKLNEKEKRHGRLGEGKREKALGPLGKLLGLIPQGKRPNRVAEDKLALAAMANEECPDVKKERLPEALHEAIKSHLKRLNDVTTVKTLGQGEMQPGHQESPEYKYADERIRLIKAGWTRDASLPPEYASLPELQYALTPLRNDLRKIPVTKRKKDSEAAQPTPAEIARARNRARLKGRIRRVKHLGEACRDHIAALEDMDACLKDGVEITQKLRDHVRLHARELL